MLLTVATYLIHALGQQLCLNKRVALRSCRVSTEHTRGCGGLFDLGVAPNVEVCALGYSGGCLLPLSPSHMDIRERVAVGWRQLQQ